MGQFAQQAHIAQYIHSKFMLCEYKARYRRKLAKKLSERGRRMAKLRWEKWRASAHERPEPEPKMHRWYRFEFGVKDKLTGEVEWHDLVSVRHARIALGLILRYCQ